MYLPICRYITFYSDQRYKGNLQQYYLDPDNNEIEELKAKELCTRSMPTFPEKEVTENNFSNFMGLLYCTDFRYSN